MYTYYKKIYCKDGIKQLLLVVALLLAAVPSGCKGHTGAAGSELVILTVNDLHGNIRVLPELAALTDEYRSRYPSVLLFSAGDLFIGNAYSDCYPAKGYPIIHEMSVAGFDASALGNHDFDFGRDTLAQRMAEATFPFLCANVSGFDASDAPLPYKIFDRNGWRVAVLGLIVREPASGIPPTSRSNVKGLIFRDPIKTAKEYRHLRDSCDLFIALTHLGIERDRELAHALPELDWIVGGHSHTLLEEPEFVNGVGITQNGKNEVVTSLLFDSSQKQGNRFSARTETVSFKRLKKKEARCAALYEEYSRQSPLNYTVATVVEPYKGKEELGYLMTDALTALPNVDLAVINPGGVRLGKLKAGDLSAKTLCDLDPFGNRVVIFDMEAADIVSLIEEEYRQSGGFLIPSGFTYRASKSLFGRGISRVELFLPDGTPFPVSKHFRVAMNNYVAENYSFTAQSSPYFTDILTMPNLIGYVAVQRMLAPDTNKRIENGETTFDVAN